jgi:3-oxoacyl-[acyl-carrier-protein] synthase III
MNKSPRAAITAMGVAVPEKVLTNDDLSKLVDTNDEWITQRTGIKQRHVVSDGQTTATLGAAAAKAALAERGLEASELDLIICATISQEMMFPATACFIQNAIGAGSVPAFDVSAACSGFLYALTIGSQFIQSGMYRRVMVIGAESLSRFTDYKDRGSCILFGDGAGAAILEPTTDPKKGIQYSVMHADGAGWNFIHVPGGGSRTPATHQTIDAGDHHIKLHGREVYKFAVEKMQWLLEDCMTKCGLTVADVDMVIPHQVNSRIIASATEKVNFPAEKVYMNIDRFGNTSAASIPIAMQEARKAGKVGPGSTIVLVAFGAGLTWAGTVLKL